METSRELRLVALAKGGDADAFDALLEEYETMASSFRYEFFLPGGDADDVLQHVRIGFYEAVCAYDPACATTFGSFAWLCISRQVVSAVKAATRGKHGPLSESLRVARDVDDEYVPVVDLLPSSPADDPAERLEQKIAMAALVAASGTLTPLERGAVMGLASGNSYAEIAAAVGREPTRGSKKAIDNAIQRGRRKLRRELDLLLAA